MSSTGWRKGYAKVSAKETPMKRHHIIVASIALLVAIALLANYYLW
jgi:hypothetical protein